MLFFPNWLRVGEALVNLRRFMAFSMRHLLVFATTEALSSPSAYRLNQSAGYIFLDDYGTEVLLR